MMSSWFAPLNVGNGFTIGLENGVILGQEFLKISKEVIIPHHNGLMFLDIAKTCRVPMMTRTKDAKNINNEFH